MTKTTKTRRTAVTAITNYDNDVIPAFLEIPPELEEVSEELRAAAMHAHETQLAAGRAFKEHQGADQRDRLAAAQAAPGNPPAQTEPDLRRALKQAQENEQAAADAARLAVLKQRRHITPDVATRWREQHAPQMLRNGEQIREKLAELVTLLGERDSIEELDKALERVQRGEGWLLRGGPIEVHQRQARKRADKMARVWVDIGQRSEAPIPNDPAHLVAALDVHSRWWEIKHEHERRHETRGRIVAEVEALGLPDLQRSEEIRRRCDEAGIPWRA